MTDKSDTPVETPKGRPAQTTVECADGRELLVCVHESGLWVTDKESGEQWPVAATDILLADESPFE